MQALRHQFDNDLEVNGRAVDGRDLLAAEGCTERAVNLAHRDAERGCAVTVDGDMDRWRRKIEVAGDVQKSRCLGERVLEALGRGEQFGRVRILQRVLILSLAYQPPDGDQRAILQVDVESGNDGEFAPKL